MLYVFQSGSEFVRLRIDRGNKKFELSSSNTNYRFLPMPFWRLFGDTRGDREEAQKELKEV